MFDKSFMVGLVIGILIATFVTMVPATIRRVTG